MNTALIFCLCLYLSAGIYVDNQQGNVRVNHTLQNSYKSFFSSNRLPQCYMRAEQPRMPRSYYVTPGYFDRVPENERVAPARKFKQPEVVPICDNRLVGPAELDAYEYETEHFLTALGLNIYDGSIFSMAFSKLGEVDEARDIWREIIYKGATCQFGNIRADAPCKGVIVKGQCDDPDHTGNCGFCYGDSADKSLPRENAWSFRMISDYWALMDTIDYRCPDLNLLWTWNDYKPILGENSWANLIAPLQLAVLKFGTVEAIPSNDFTITMAIEALPALEKMLTPVGAVYYSPRNVLVFNNVDVGDDVSTENNISLLSGLKMLRYILSKKGIHLQHLALINKLIDSITNYIRSSYDPALGYFRQGGKYNPETGFQWATGDSIFAVDCQTWAMTVINPLLIDQWFGLGSAKAIWKKTKELGGYKYDASTELADGVGFSFNQKDQVFSGEWSYGAVNMLRVFAQQYSDPSFNYEAEHMRASIIRELGKSETIDGVPVTGIVYANKRYWIPFGWWANPLLSTASTGWAVLIDSQFNPFYLGGYYLSDY